MTSQFGVDLPPEFISHNNQDPAWLRALPDLLDSLAGRWSLNLGPYFPHIAYNYVAPATRRDGTDCVLKVSRFVGEMRQEVEALRLWQGDGAVLLLDADPDLGALLVERVEPGTTLAELAQSDDDAATVIGAGVVRRLWRSPPECHGLRSLESWCAAYDRNRDALSRGADGFPAMLFERADAVRRELLASTRFPTILHGDLHPLNVLRAQRADWLAIDPKGLAGDRCFDVCQFVRDARETSQDLSARRLDILCGELGLDRARTKAWCFVHAVLDACWDFEDGKPWQLAVSYAEHTCDFWDV